MDNPMNAMGCGRADDVSPEPQLLDACEHGHLSTLCRLISARDDVPPGTRALLGVAASKGHTEIVRCLLARYHSQQFKVDQDHAYLATFGGLDCYRLIYERDPTLLHATFEYSGDALQLAVFRSDVDLLNFLLNHGCDPGRIITNNTPLWAHRYVPIETAVLCSGSEIARILIRHGASLKGTAALDLAASLGKRNRLEMVVCLVQEGADINAVGQGYETSRLCERWGPPLNSAIEAQHVEIVEYLLEKGANPWIKDAGGENAIEKASGVHNDSIIRLLQRKPGM